MAAGAQNAEIDLMIKVTVQAGFQPAELSADFAADLANYAPLPQDRAF